ncbi:carbohydrate ABC transporter permease [Candidatus Roseilinea sp. NK_OTU-006]|jgi:ABC-type glycerol-3-phosphate transport system permease component|uniref:carbohydrate ABC transporter permease n=1 Tax=Candidatus Roseilinea sp. NK_OTU-006 TaxID=2704250 RepID=UPI00145E5F90|nr:carbohydrate ABC transporter permease [Candidatus Roseilinea sp. NK_OTU-006]
MRLARAVDSALLAIAVFIFLFIVLFPFYWIVLSSFTPKYELFTIPPRYWFSTFTLENYQALANSIPLVRYFVNSLLFAAGSSLVSVAAAFLASYALARIQFRGANLIFIAFVMSIALPQIGGLVPLFELFKSTNLINTYHGLVILMSSLVLPFTIWILVPFLRQIPYEIEEAAIMDGARLPQLFWFITLPIMRPALVTMFIINFIIAWNELIYPLVFATSGSNKTLSVGLVELAVQPTAGGGRPWDLLSAMSVVMIVPILVLVLLFQRLIVSGLTRGAIK